MLPIQVGCIKMRMKAKLMRLLTHLIVGSWNPQWHGNCCGICGGVRLCRRRHPNKTTIDYLATSQLNTRGCWHPIDTGTSAAGEDRIVIINAIS